MKKNSKKENMTILSKSALIKIKGGSDKDDYLIEDVGGM